ncbi:uncharacterized protein LOC135140619 [Zophobas morio]|uniref:uncharacterized protein LOC135140619 n=1 Tax=Zophobas morio TaxID=2755281 RepID=UPI003083E3F1
MLTFNTTHFGTTEKKDPETWEFVDKNGLLIQEMMDEYDNKVGRTQERPSPSFANVVRKTDKPKKKRRKKANYDYQWDDESAWVTYETIIEDPAAKYKTKTKKSLWQMFSLADRVCILTVLVLGSCCLASSAYRKYLEYQGI